MTASADILTALPWLKWMWVGVVAAGVGVCGWMLRQAWVDARWVKAHSHNAAKRIQAAASLRKSVVLFGFQLALLLIRLWALGWPQPARPDTPFAAFVRNWGWDATMITALQALLAYECLLDGRDRRKVADLVRPRTDRP